MARNGSGTYTVPKSFTPNTTITSADQNANWTDIGNEMTNSLALDGQSVMTGVFKAASGSNTNPSIAFGSDLDTGWYRSSANKIGGAVGGAKAIEVSSSGVDATAGKILEKGFALIPAGAIIDYAGSSAPDGWLLCYGQAVSRATYADLFSAIGTTYGAGDNSTTFNLPDKRGRVSAGKDDMGGSSANRLTDQSGGLDGDTLGDTGGAETVTLALTEIPSHDHGGSTSTSGTHNHNDGTHTYLLKPPYVGSITGGDTTGSGTEQAVGGGDGAAIQDSGSHSHTITSAGGGGAHNNVQPTIIFNSIIKT